MFLEDLRIWNLSSAFLTLGWLRGWLNDLIGRFDCQQVYCLTHSYFCQYLNSIPHQFLKSFDSPFSSLLGKFPVSLILDLFIDSPYIETIGQLSQSFDILPVEKSNTISMLKRSLTPRNTSVNF